MFSIDITAIVTFAAASVASVSVTLLIENIYLFSYTQNFICKKNMCLFSGYILYNASKEFTPFWNFALFLLN